MRVMIINISKVLGNGYLAEPCVLESYTDLRMHIAHQFSFAVDSQLLEKLVCPLTSHFLKLVLPSVLLLCASRKRAQIL